MWGHIYIKRNGVTVIYKANDYDTIYFALINMGYDHESAEDVASWAELASIGDEYFTGSQDEIHIGE